MAKKKKGLLDKVLHPGGESSEAGEHELEGEGQDGDAGADLDVTDGTAPLASEQALEGDKHQHKKFDKFKRGN